MLSVPSVPSVKCQVHYIELKLETVFELSERQVCQVPSAKCRVNYIELKLEMVL